jgi:hypothetical protein
VQVDRGPDDGGACGSVDATEMLAIPARMLRRVLLVESASTMSSYLLVGVRAGREVAPSPRLVFMVPRFMAKTSVVPKKKRGPPATGQGIQVGERWHPKELAAIDAWIANSGDKTLTRAHAIRRLVALGLKAKGT